MKATASETPDLWRMVQEADSAANMRSVMDSLRKLSPEAARNLVITRTTAVGKTPMLQKWRSVMTLSSDLLSFLRLLRVIAVTHTELEAFSLGNTVRKLQNHDNKAVADEAKQFCQESHASKGRQSRYIPAHRLFVYQSNRSGELECLSKWHMFSTALSIQVARCKEPCFVRQ